MTGTVDQTMSVVGHIAKEASLKGQLIKSANLTGSVIISGQTQRYTGDYIVEPKANREIVLQTNGKVLDDDVTVMKVQSSTTTNTSGGKTVYIAI